jgi:hypothetical protein
MRRTWASIAATATLVLAACGANVGPSSVTPPPATPLPPGSQAAVDQAVQDAAAHLALNAGELRVDHVEAREWSDSSLGCPQAGSLYSQVITPGFLIQLSTRSGNQLEYHADSRGHVVLCKEI